MTTGKKDLSPLLETKLGYTFANKTLLQEALTHPSSLIVPEDSQRKNYQRLEFLGDAVLGLHLAEELFKLFPETREGELSQLRASLVRGSTLASLARKLDLGSFLTLSPGEESTGGRDRDKLLEDAFEALVGALYLDAGMAKTSAILQTLYGNCLQEAQEILANANPKGQLQEFLQALPKPSSLSYHLVSKDGPDHDRIFTAEVQLDGKPMGRGKGSSKKKAEELAAQEALRKLTTSTN